VDATAGALDASAAHAFTVKVSLSKV
jgi:hypothetical protein